MNPIVDYTVRALFAGGVAVFGPITPVLAADRETTVTIASGTAGGLYYPVAGALCRLVNERTSEHGITCTVDFGIGSITNIEAMRNGEVTLAMTQSDIQRDALAGSVPFEDEGSFTTMRSVVSLFVEQVTIVAREDKDIATFEDLKGKRVYLAAPGSGGRILIQELIEAEGWSPDDIVDVAEYEAADLADALCDGEFDAFSVTVGHPSPLVKEAADTCDITLVPVEGPAAAKLIGGESLYAASVIPAGMYRNVNRDVAGLGLVATLVTTDSVDADVIYEITKALFEGLGRLREASPLFDSLSDKQMANDGLSAPLHDGAARYYAETGLR